MISECCYAEDRCIMDGPYYSEIGQCPECRENCIFIKVVEIGEEVVEIRDDGYYQEGKRIVDESIVYQIEQILDARTGE